MRRRGGEPVQAVSEKYRFWKKHPVATLERLDRKPVTIMTGRRLWGTKEPVSHLKERLKTQINAGRVGSNNAELASDGLRIYASEEATRTITVDTALLVTGIVANAVFDYDANTLLGLLAVGTARGVQIGLRRRSLKRAAQELQEGE